MATVRAERFINQRHVTLAGSTACSLDTVVSIVVMIPQAMQLNWPQPLRCRLHRKFGLAQGALEVFPRNPNRMCPKGSA